MARKVYYRGEGDENTFHDTTAEQLRANERAATDDFSEASEQTAGDYSDNLDNRRDAENDPRQVNANARGKKDDSGEGGFYRGKGGASEEDGGNSKVKGKKKSKFKKFGPVMLILMGIFGVGGLSFMGNMLGPFALISNALDQFNGMRIAMNTRTTYFTRFQMDETLNKSLTNKKFGIFSREKVKIGRRKANKLSAQGIEYEVDESSGARYLRFTNPDTGEVSNIVANTKDLNSLNDSGMPNVKMIDNALETDNSFFKAHQSATKTVKGHIVGWFESLTNALYERFETTRNRFKGTTSDTDEEEVKRKAQNGGLSEDVGDSEGGSVRRYYYEEEYEGEDGKTHTRIVDLADDFDPDTDSIPSGAKLGSKIVASTGGDALNADVGSSTVKVKSALQVKAEKAASVVGDASKAVGIVCGVVNAFSALNLAITAIQTAKTINFTTAVTEAIQRTQIGDGGSEMMVMFNEFSEPKSTEEWTAANDDGTEVNKTVVSGKSTMASTAYNATFGGPAVDPDDPSAQKFNRDNATKNAFSSAFDSKSAKGNTFLGWFIEALGTSIAGASSMVAYKSCLYAKVGLSIASLAADAISVIVGVFTYGIGTLLIQLGKTIVRGIIKAVVYAAVMTFIGYIISWLVPKVAQLLTMNLLENLGGEDAANALRSGFNLTMGKSMQANSGGVGTKEAVLAMYGRNQEILADDARYDRLTLSPLDPTSKYTFVGSIVQSLMPMANMVAGSAPLSALGSVMRTVSQSALTALPSASAASEVWYERDLQEDCPNLGAIGLVGDSYCNPYYTTDFSTIEENPCEVVNNVGLNNFEGMDGIDKLICGSEGSTTTTFEPGLRYLGADGIYMYDEEKGELALVEPDSGGSSHSSSDGTLASASGVDTIAFNESETVDFSKITTDDNPAIKLKKENGEATELGKYIISCTTRDSQYGVVDAQIYSWIQHPTGSTVGDALVGGIMNLVPIGNELYDLAQSNAEASNFKWNSGMACKQDSSSNPDWEQNKWYQRYVSDQTLMEAAGIIPESQVAVFVEKYYEENPIDNSLEGVIARYSGMSKEEAENVVALAEYIQFIANYDSSERYPLPVDKTSDAEIALKSINSAIASTRLQMPSSESFLPAPADELADTVSLEPTASLAAAERVIYFDLRSRVYTV